MADALELCGVARTNRRLVRIEILPDLPTTISTIAEAVSAAMRGGELRGRLLADFGSMAGPETISELEGLISGALRGLDVISVTQYDGRSLPASATIAQFQTHALTIVGNAVCKENRNYTPPEYQARHRAAGAKA